MLRLCLLVMVSLASISIAYPLIKVESRATAAVRRAAAINFGTCSDPEVQDINGVFSVTNSKDFGSVSPSVNLDDVVLGVCNILATKCGVDGITDGDCSTAASDAIGVGNTAAADDLFNSVLGFVTHFASSAAAPPAASSAALTTTTSIAATSVTNTQVAAAAKTSAAKSKTGNGKNNKGNNKGKKN